MTETAVKREMEGHLSVPGTWKLCDLSFGTYTVK